jgi:hypothetical protein
MKQQFFENNTLTFDAEIKLMKLLGASEEVINELLEMKSNNDF